VRSQFLYNNSIKLMSLLFHASLNNNKVYTYDKICIYNMRLIWLDNMEK
jgi:hypothetical protein